MPKPPKFASLSLEEPHYSYDHLDAMERVCYIETFQAEAEFMAMRLQMFKTTLASTCNSCAATMHMDESLRVELERHVNVTLDEFIARYRNLNIMNGFEELGKPKPKSKAECEKRMKSWQTQNRPKGYGYTLYRYMFHCVYKLFDPSKLVVVVPDLFRQFFRYRALLQVLKMNIDYGIKGSSQPLFVAGSSFMSSMSPLAKQCEIFVTEKKRIPIVCASREAFLEYVREKATYYGRLVRKQEGGESEMEEETETDREEVGSVSKESFRSHSSKQSRRDVKTRLHHGDDLDVSSQGSHHSMNRNAANPRVKTETMSYQLNLPPDLPSIPYPNDAAWDATNVVVPHRPAYGAYHSGVVDTTSNWAPYPPPCSQQMSNNLQQVFPQPMTQQQSEGQLSFGIPDVNELTDTDIGWGELGTSTFPNDVMDVDDKVGAITDDEKSSLEWQRASAQVERVRQRKTVSSNEIHQQLQQLQFQQMQHMQGVEMQQMQQETHSQQTQSSDVAVEHLVHVANIFQDLLGSFPSPHKLQNIDAQSYEKLRKSFEFMRAFYTTYIKKYDE